MSTREQSRRFHFLREIASGGFGSVYLTKVMHSDGFSRLVAVKLLHRRWSENEEIARRMRDEARLLGWLRHRNIVDVFDLTSIDGRAAVVMEYLEAIDLKQIIQHAAETGGSIPARPALEIMARVASALDAAYNRPPYPGEKPLRVIHRDIKPSNIMVDDDGTVKVLDFGVARADFDSRESHTRELQFGSVDYMPPERLFFEPETPASDVYSLAATIFEFLVLEKLGKARGRPQKHERFLADRMSYLRAASTAGPMSSALEQLLGECLSYEHAERPPAADVAQRATQLARKIDGPDLREWAEDSLPAQIQAWQGRELPPNPLSDKVVNEDRVSLEDSGPVAAQEQAEEEEEPEVPRSDPRWEALRQAALDELRPPSIPNPATAPPMPVTPKQEPQPSTPLMPKPQPSVEMPKPQPSVDFPAAAPPPPPPPPPQVAPPPPPAQQAAPPPPPPAAFGGASGLEPVDAGDGLEDVNAPSLPYHLKQQAADRGFSFDDEPSDADAATRIGPALPTPPPQNQRLERPPAPSMHMDLDELFGGSPPPPPVGAPPPAPEPPAAPPPPPPLDEDDTPVLDASKPPGLDDFDDLAGFDEFGDDGFGGAGLSDLDFGDAGAPSSINDFEDDEDIDPELMATRIEPVGDKLDEVLSKISKEEAIPSHNLMEPSAPSLDDWGDIPTRLETNPLKDEISQPPPQSLDAATLIRPVEQASPAAPIGQAAPPMPPASPSQGPPSYDAPANFGGPPAADAGPPQAMEVWPPPPPPEAEAPAPKKKKKKKRSGLLMTVGVAMFAVMTGACLGGVVLIFGEDIRSALLSDGGPTAEVEAPAEDAATQPSEPPEEAAVAAPEGPSMHFVSLAPETRKLNVSCAGLERASGASEVYVAAASAEKCSVTAILKRGRHTAIVTDASEGEYKCFEGGENKCER